MNVSDANYDFVLTLFYNFESASNLISPLLVSYILGIIQLAEINSPDNKLYKLLSYDYGKDDLINLAESYQSNLIYTETWLISQSILNKTWLKTIDDLVEVVNEGQINKIMEHIYNISGYEINIKPNVASINFLNVCIINCRFKTVFNRADTSSSLFFETDNVLFMKQVNWFNYYQNDKVKLIEILLEDETFTLGIILPLGYIQSTNTDYTINNIPYITRNNLREWINNMVYSKVYLSIPKFKHIKNVGITNVLQKMGIDSNVDNIACQTIFIAGDSIIDKPKLEQDIINDTEIKFVASHPFIYYLRNVESDVIVAIGDYQGYSI